MDLLQNQERGVFRNKRAQKIQQAQEESNGQSSDYDASPNYNTTKVPMGITFGEKGFYKPQRNKSGKNSPKMQAIPEQSEAFEENMLLSFYDWPKVETSAVFKASLEDKELK